MVNNSLIQPVKPGPVLKTTIFSENHWSNHGPLDVGASHSASFDHLRRPLRTAMAGVERLLERRVRDQVGATGLATTQAVFYWPARDKARHTALRNQNAGA